MIYILGKLENIKRYSAEIELVKLLNETGTEAKLILSTPVYNWALFRTENISTEQVTTIYHLFCQREVVQIQPYGLDSLPIDPTWQLVKNLAGPFFYIDDLGTKKAEVTFFDTQKQLLKSLTLFEEAGQKLLEYDDRGFLFSITEHHGQGKVRTYLDVTNTPRILVEYVEHNLLKITLLQEGIVFESESEFSAWCYDSLIAGSQEQDRFLLVRAREVHRYLTKTEATASKVFVLPDFSIQELGTLGFRQETFRYGEYAGLITETKAEAALYQETFGGKTPMQLTFNNTFSTEEILNQRFREERKYVYVNLGSYGTESELQQIMATLLATAKKNDYDYLIELHGVKKNVQVKKIIEEDSYGREHVQLLGRPHKQMMQEKMKQSSVYLLLDEQLRQSVSLMVALSNKLPVIIDYQSPYAAEIENFKTGLVITKTNLTEAMTTIASVYHYMTENLPDLAAQSNRFERAATSKRWKAIIYGENC